jgi:hypothetical protein
VINNGTEAEVDQNRASLGSVEDISRFDIVMNDLFLAEVLESMGHVTEDTFRIATGAPKEPVTRAVAPLPMSKIVRIDMLKI